MNDATDPDVLLAEILARPKLRAKRKAGLEAFQRICRAQAATSKDFSRATIGRLCEAAGLSHGRMLYNGSATEYLELLEAWERFAGKKRELRQDVERPARDWIAGIDSPSLRQLVQRLKRERDCLFAELNLLKSKVEITVHWTVPRPSTQEPNVQVIETIGVKLSVSERDALEDAIGPALLAREGWTAGPHGEITNEHGRQVFRPGYISALKKVLSRKTQ